MNIRSEINALVKAAAGNVLTAQNLMNTSPRLQGGMNGKRVVPSKLIDMSPRMQGGMNGKRIAPSSLRKKANWLTDTLIVNPLTALYRRQNGAYKAEQAKAKVQTATVSPSATTKKTAPNRTDDLTRIAQGVSNSYQQGSFARPKYMSQGKVIAR